VGALDQLLKNEKKELPPFPELGLKTLQTFLTKAPREIEEFLFTESEIVNFLIETANLPFYRKGEVPIDNPRMAILVLGEDTAKVLTLGLISRKIFRHTFNEFSFPKFWARAITQLVAGFYLADLIEGFPAHLPLSAYLMDYGIVLLYLINPEKYLQVFHLRKEGDTLIGAEEKLFQTNHAIVGAEYFETYSLPRRFILNIRYHHQEEIKDPLPKEIFQDLWFLKMIDHAVGSFFSQNREERWKAFEMGAKNYLSQEEIETFGEVFPAIANRYLEIFNLSEFRLKTFKELEEEKQKELERLKLEEIQKTKNLLQVLEDHQHKILQLTREKREFENRVFFLQEKIEQESIYDELTGAYKETYFLKRLKEELLKAKRYRRTFSFLTVELDKLKEIGRIFGLNEEENLLKHLTQGILKSLRRIDLVGRAKEWGKLYILLPETPSQGAMVVARKILRRVEEISHAFTQKTISAYITVITYDPKEIDPKKEPSEKTLIDLSHKGLEIIKRRGQARIILLTIEQEIENQKD